MENTDEDTKQPTMGPPLVDIDCNLLHKDLMSVMGTVSTLDMNETLDNLPDAFKILHHPSITQSNIIAMLSPSSTIEESESSVNLLESSTVEQRNNILVKTTVGVHPYHTLEAGAPTSETLDRLRSLLDKPNTRQFISCIGETGLDYSEGFPDKEHQLPWFQAQLDLSFEYNLPVFLHERLAFGDTLKCIDKAAEKHEGKNVPRIIVHCYTGSFVECVEYMKRGYYLSVSGYINKQGEENDEVRRCLREGIVPLDRLMIETDSPYLGFALNKDSFFEAEGASFASLNAKKKKRLKSLYPNVPSSLPLVLKAACDELNCGREKRGESLLSLEELADCTTKNAISFVNL